MVEASDKPNHPTGMSLQSGACPHGASYGAVHVTNADGSTLAQKTALEAIQTVVLVLYHPVKCR
jgi:hypothetical protein